MGTRIHKAMGYGFDNLVEGDPRFNVWDYESLENKKEEFPNWLVSNEEEAKCILKGYDYDVFGVRLLKSFILEEKINFISSNLTICNTEYGLKNVFVFMPLDYTKEWYRYDNMIDYEEQLFIVKEGYKNSIFNLFKDGNSCGIYPYNTSMKRLPNRKLDFELENNYFNNKIMNGELMCVEYNELVGRWDKYQPPICKDKKVLEHLLNDWRPKVPNSIVLFAHYANLFKDPLTVFELEPMIYTWWS